MPIPAALAAAGIQGVGNLLGGLIGNAGRRREAERQRKFQIDFWNRQNEYNTPKNQMERFEQAGLNKNLIYGQGNPGNAGAIGQYQQPDIQNIPFGDAIGQYYNVQLQQKQIDNVDAQTQNLKQEKMNKILDGFIKLGQGDKTRSEATTAKAQAAYSKEFFKLQNDNAAQDLKNKISQVNLNSRQAQKAISETKLNNKDLEWMKRTGLHKNDPILAKNVKYLSEVTGLKPSEIVFAVGGILGIKQVLQGAGSLLGKGIFNKATKKIKN